MIWMPNYITILEIIKKEKKRKKKKNCKKQKGNKIQHEMKVDIIMKGCFSVIVQY